MRVNKPIDLGLLRQQLIAGGIADPGPLGTTGQDANGFFEVVGYDGTGHAVSLPSAADAILTAHDASIGGAAADAAAAAAALSGYRQQYQAMKAGLVTIRGHMDAINAGPAAPSATQTGTALKTIASDITTICNGLDRLLDALATILPRAGGG